MKPKLPKWFKNFKTSKNIEQGIVLFVAIATSILGIFTDLLNEKIILGIIVVLLGLLVWGLKDSGEESEKILYKRNRLTQLENKLANNGITELWVYAPSAIYFLSPPNLAIIEERLLSKKNGSFRVVLQNPNNEDAISILKNQLDDGTIKRYGSESIESDIKRTLEGLSGLKENNFKGEFTYGFMGYGLGFSIVAFNPTEDDGEIVLEIHGFLNKTNNDRMNVVIRRKDHREWYEYWLTQMNEIWNKATDKYNNHESSSTTTSHSDDDGNVQTRNNLSMN